MNQPQKKLWMIISSYYPWIGGAERQAQGLSEKMIEQKWSVVIITRRHNNHFEQVLPVHDEYRGVPVERLFSAGPKKLRFITFLLSNIVYFMRHASSREIFYAHDIGSTAIIAGIASKLKRGKAIVKIRSQKDDYSSWSVNFQLKLLARLIDRFIVLSDEGKTMLEECVPQAKIWLIPNGVDTDIFKAVTVSQKMHLRESLRLPLTKYLFVVNGRLIPLKAYDILIKAISRLRNEIKADLQCVIIGDGPERESLMQMVATEQLSNTVFFVGQQENPVVFLQASDVYILPSRGEGLSNAMLEAMSSGLPVICSSVGGAIDWVKPGKNGYLFAPGDIAELTSLIEKMVEERDRWESMGKLSRQIIEDNLSLSYTARKFEQNLLSLLQR